MAELVTAGEGLTDTVMIYGTPGHVPEVEVGATRYCTVPTVELLGLVSTWLIVDPDPALAPVIPPVTVPIVQLNVPGTEEVKLIFGFDPLQMMAVLGEVTIETG